MSTIIVALIIIGGIVVITSVLVYINKKHSKEKREKLLQRFSQLGSEYQLTYASQEIFKERIIGLDGVHRKLLVLEDKDGGQSHQIIHLEEVSNCSVKKVHAAISADAKQKNIDSPLQSIALQFDFKDKKPALLLPFYDSIANHVFEIAELEAKAKDWESILSKMLVKENKKIA